ncbi:proteinaceous RNase P 1, chloroplastic/mitochondrial-like [Musa acuminata AAA Group]|uniref:proteinaceous RNase P 1, chloroplastic/mitochondrial-like n=1 Tax=Musa acuminata AAA Group TaxID=214697 RepID=UPI0031D44473
MASVLSIPFPRELLASFTSRPKYQSPFALKSHSFSHFLTLSPLGRTIVDDFSKISAARTPATNVDERIALGEQTHDRRAKHQRTQGDERVGRNGGRDEGGTASEVKNVELGVAKQRPAFLRSRGEGTARKSKKMTPWVRRDEEKEEERRMKKKSKKPKLREDEIDLRVKLDMCSKTGDVMGAIALYDSAVKEGIKLKQYHYNVLLYLCSAAAIGVIHPAKSGSSGSNPHYSSDESSSKHSAEAGEEDGELVHEETAQHTSESNGALIKDASQGARKDGVPIQVSEDIRNYARTRGLEIYEKMCLEKIPMSEAALTSVARVAMSMGNGDMAFEIVKQLKPLGVTPKLRSYGPALLTFCNDGDVDKAFEVEAHMSQNGVHPEEPELEALMRASVAARRGEKVYYLLHKLRTNVRQVSPSTAAVLEAWFRSAAASRLGKRKWDVQAVAEAIENGGGGWHGQGWLGKGKWNVSHTGVSTDGVCMACGDKLVTIDLDPIETENFANSVASLANKRERNSNFHKFQKWLDYYGPFEAVVDAANIGLFSQRRFSINKVNAVVNAIRQKLPMKRWPLIIVHNKRLTGGKMNAPLNMKLLEKWKYADAIYETPTGSNDDWYWLYAAIKCKCLIVTNDEMRDHIFQVLGNDFFPRWKERHQVHFSFHEGSFEFDMPPPCSIVIQENERGHWHIPISTVQEQERERTWLCVTRAHKAIEESTNPPRESCVPNISSNPAASYVEAKNCVASKEHSKKTSRSSLRCKADCKANELHTVISDIEAAEKLHNCVIDFQI